MKSIKKNSFLVLFLLCGFVYGQGYEIKFKINNLSNQPVILGHHFNAQLIPDDTVQVDKKGNGVFAGKEPLKGGMYIIFLPNKSYFDILISDNQHFSFENDTIDFIENMKITNSEENSIFFDYQKFLSEQGEKAQNLRTKRTATTDAAEISKIDTELQEINNLVRAKMKNLETNYPNLLFTKFLKATTEVEIPTGLSDREQYYYYKDHYFDNFDVGDARLLRTPIYENKLDKFIRNIIPQHPDSIVRYVDELVAKSRSDQELFRYMLVHLFNEYAASTIMGMDAVYVHIAENYYIKEATWSDSAFIADLKTKVVKKKPNLIGKKAQEIIMLQVPYEHLLESISDSLVLKDIFYGNYISLHSLQAKYTILFFWEADCSHCKTATPALYKVYERLKDKGLEVIAVNMLSGEEGKKKWADFVKKHEMYDWLNVWDPSYQSQYKHKYDIASSPVLFLLDKDKKIIAKRIAPEQAEEIIIDLLVSEIMQATENNDELQMKKLKEFAQTFVTKECLTIAKPSIIRYLKDDKLAELQSFIDNLIEKLSSEE